MMELTSQQCTSISDSAVSVLDHEEITTLLQQLNTAWTLETKDQTISRDFSFKNYYQTMAFVNVVAQIAHQQDHHPDLLVSYNHCTITYCTHSVNGISIKDLICAAKINAAQNL